MRGRTAIMSSVLVTALLGTAWPGASGVRARPSWAGTSPWTGTFTFVMKQDYSLDSGGGDTYTITANCNATITRHADGTASATATYSSHEVRTSGTTQQGNQETQTYDVPSTTFSDPAYQPVPSFELDGQGGYSVNASAPSVTVVKTVTIARQGSNSFSQTYTSGGVCNPGPGSATGKLPGGTTVTGSKTWSLLQKMTVTMEWTIQDSTLQGTNPANNNNKPANNKNENPTGKIKVTNNGIDASLSWKGWEIGYAGDWKASQSKPSAPPKITSPDQKVQITINEQPAPQPSSKITPQSTITQAGQSAGGVQSISFKPFAIGNLTGQIGVITLANSPDTLLVVVVGDAQHQVIAQTRVKPNTPPLDLLQAGMAIGSIRPPS